MRGRRAFVGPEAFVIDHIKEVMDAAAGKRLPGISVYRAFVTAGELMPYGPDLIDIFRRGAAYVDRILRGASPATLPVQEPTKFQLVVNQHAARDLGLSLPPTLIVGADEVVE